MVVYKLMEEEPLLCGGMSMKCDSRKGRMKLNKYR